MLPLATLLTSANCRVVRDIINLCMRFALMQDLQCKLPRPTFFIRTNGGTANCSIDMNSSFSHGLQETLCVLPFTAFLESTDCNIVAGNIRRCINLAFCKELQC
eukprot:gnl/MRDRNA2_/MRDRNA2_40822_c0_seq1.p1 gnl/MRDRNA2_/MRDRNA2_40822_c0~~gnl/MRDRNA2_/MRDRNA2_40822_c0_seq1.p1  ORF type:complete len:104 (-),score=8.62 gnl/MRDRNA2_/MRDRNA2_40822_c0_seq1:624-935(-)